VPAVCFCWVCGRLWDRTLDGETHYEDGRELHFCSRAHRAEYQWLACL
jgi:hypothetical protein